LEAERELNRKKYEEAVGGFKGEFSKFQSQVQQDTAALQQKYEQKLAEAQAVISKSKPYAEYEYVVTQLNTAQGDITTLQNKLQANATAEADLKTRINFLET